MRIFALIFALTLGLVVSFSALASSDGDEQRVLLRFDDAGHHVQKVFNTTISGKSFLSANKELELEGEFPDINALSADVEQGLASLAWLDSRGRLIAVTSAPDPRVFHSPAHIAGVTESRLSSQSGAWLVTGPSIAEKLLILLPVSLSPALAPEQWEVLL